MQVIAKEAEVRVSRIHEIAKEMLPKILPKILRKMILPTYGAFSPGEMFLKLLLKITLQKPIVFFANLQKENEQSRLSL